MNIPHPHERKFREMSMKTTFVLATSLSVAAFLALSPAGAQQKTRKECREEWAANRTAIAAAGKTQRVFLAECRGIPLPAPSALDADAGKGQFSNEAEAKASCPSDAVVWANLQSKIYHASDSKSYGATRSGAYMCEHASAAAGFRAAKPFIRAAAARQ
jgi:hypothetical protein